MNAYANSIIGCSDSKTHQDDVRVVMNDVCNVRNYTHNKNIFYKNRPEVLGRENHSDQGLVVQSIVSLTSSLRGQIVKCFFLLYNQMH